MGIATSIVSAVLKSVVGDKIGNGLTKDLIGISIDGVSEKGINEITDFINSGKCKIDSILSKENMKSIGILEGSIDYVIEEIKDLLSKINITDEVLRQCRYDSMNLCAFLWNEYCEYKNSYIEYESEIKRGLFAVAEALVKLVRESENFEKDVLIYISNSADGANAELQKISEYMRENFGKLHDNSQIVLNILLMILEQIQKMNMQDSETKSTTDEQKKFQNSKKQKYIENWNSRLFLHVDNDENPITLADAFIMPDYIMHKNIKRIGFSDNDTLDQIIEKFVEYNKTSTMLITGVPGMGKSSITSWIANKYKDDDRFIVLRFRDWDSEELENGIVNAICNTLKCCCADLNSKILIIDGFDELKLLDIREELLNGLSSDILDWENMKLIITSRPAYINSRYFQNVVILKVFDIDRIGCFYEKIKGYKLASKMKIKFDLEVLGVPVILYMAIMSDVDINEKSTKPELYNCIFAEEGGIFDKFCVGGVGYDDGTQPMRNRKNINSYLEFLQEVAFKMFEKNKLVLSKDEYHIPILEFKGYSVSVLEFPIKHLFENMECNIEFIHKSIAEYFASEYIFMSIHKAMNINADKERLAGIFGDLFKSNHMSSELLEFLKFRIINSDLNTKAYMINEIFQLMLCDGMTFYVNKKYKNIVRCELLIFTNMLELLHMWEEKVSLKNIDYLKYNIDNKLNLKNVELSKRYLRGVDLRKADLQKAGLRQTVLRRADLRYADLRGADLCYADLSGSDIRGANLEGAKVKGLILRGTIVDESQAVWLDKKVNLSDAKVCINVTQKIINYSEYKKDVR